MSTLLAWGANSHGQLGLGIQSEQATSPEVIHLDKLNLNPAEIEKISGGAGHSLILDKHGRVHACGWNKQGQTGIQKSEVFNFETIETLKNERITDLCCGWDSSMVLNDNGIIFGWGSNVYGQLGIPQKDCLEPHKPQRINFDFQVRKIAMGLRHSAVVTENGQVLTTGAGKKGQLGHVDDKNMKVNGTNVFTLVPDIQDVIDIACGQYFTIALTKSGDIYTWGDNKYGQLGVDNNDVISSCVPIKLSTHFGPIKTIATGWTHASILTEDGRIFSWGRGCYGQLGTMSKNISWGPKVVENLDRVQQLLVGSEHNVALTDCRRIYSWGWNEHGNCGIGNTTDVAVPQKIPVFQARENNEINVNLIGGGAAHTFAVVVTK